MYKRNKFYIVDLLIYLLLFDKGAQVTQAGFLQFSIISENGLELLDPPDSNSRMLELLVEHSLTSQLCFVVVFWRQRLQ